MGTSGLAVDEASMSVTLDGRGISLTLSEFRLLAMLVRHPRTVITAQALLAEIWGVPWTGDTAALQVHISRLRAKLGESSAHPRYIRTVRGVGYAFEPGPPAADEPAGAPPDGDHTSQVRLAYDADLVLVSLDPPVELLGWAPEAIIGTTFSLAGVDVATQRGIITMARAAGMTEIDQEVTLVCSDGRAVRRRVRIELHVDADGEFAGMLGTIYLIRDDGAPQR